jgi:glutathione S-transferase
MQLYYTPGTCSLSPHIVAREAGIEIDLVKVDIATKLTESGADYRRINPKGSVPALALGDGRMLTEGPALVQYLADLRPDSGLAPANGSFERYQLQEWLNWVSTELHKGFSPLWRKDTPQDVQQATKEALALKFAYLDHHLGTSPYLLADFSIADAYAFAVLGWAKFFAIDLARWPNVAAYVARIAARPAVRAALVAEGLIAADTEAA